jgi:hypothetical protein
MASNGIAIAMNKDDPKASIKKSKESLQIVVQAVSRCKPQ